MHSAIANKGAGEGIYLCPLLLLLDIQLPGIPGSEGVPVLQGKYPQLEIIMLTVLAAADKVFASICYGACGYVLNETP